MSKHINIPDPRDKNHELITILWDGLKIKGDGKCYCPCSKCRVFKRRRIKITIAKRHCREYGHAEGGHDYRPFVSFSLYMYLYFLFCKCMYHFNISYIK